MSSNKQPNFFIIGAPKCGTTSMYEYLKQHPDIYFPEVKEPNYYNTDLTRAKRPSKERYFSLYDAVSSEKIIGDATPLYLMSKEATKNIKETHPTAKILIMVRKPSEVVYSAFFQNQFNGCEIIKDFEEAFYKQKERRGGYKLPSKVLEPIERLEYDRFVNYQEDIPRWINAFGKENVLILLMDDLKRDQEITIKKVLDFLDVDSSNFNPEQKVHNPATTNKSNTLKRIVKSPPKALTSILRAVFPKKTRAKIFDFIREKNKVQLKKPSLDSGFEKELIQHYLPQTTYIENLLGVQLNHWKK